ncbi:hypothetical protein [Piscinibacter sakaiensis]|uniref:hypothetical protein n=1 Tax=Piscinibacter sakaiensis TaxID=1547922 RepID=UPI003AB02CDA
MAVASTTGRLPTCIVCHIQRRLVWHERNATFSAEFFVLAELPPETEAFKLAFSGGAGMQRARKEPADRWLSGGGAYRLTVKSQSVKLHDSTVLTMLTLAK